MPIDPNFSSVYCYTWQINFSQCAPNGYLKYTDLCNFLQLTAAEHARLGGISFTDMQQYHQAWVLCRMRIEISKLPQWQDNITVKTWIQSLEGSRSVRNLEVYLNDQKIIGATTFWAVFNTQTRKSEALALPYQHFKIFAQHSATVQSFKKIIIPKPSKKIIDYTVKLSDLDIVNHANNIKYLEWCLDTLPATKILSQTIQSLDFNYVQELFIADIVSINQYIDNNKYYFGIAKEDKNCFTLLLEFKD